MYYEEMLVLNNFEAGEIVYHQTKYGRVKATVVRVINENFVIINKGYGEQRVRAEQLIKEQEQLTPKEKEIMEKLQKEFGV
jgi:ferredoxin-fold anticodon binding domain-containing protein